MEVLAACHMHSTWSYDGSLSLEALSALCLERGYRILLMTEHDRGFTKTRHEEFRAACAQASSDRIFVMPGIEYSDAANRVHVLTWGAPFLGEGLPTGDMLAAVKSANGVAVLAHPTRKTAWKSFEASWASALVGIELWNRKYDGWAPSVTAPGLIAAANAVPFVGMDFHTHRQLFPLAMALRIDGEISEQNILNTLRERRCEARAFGMRLDHQVVRTALPALRVAEQSRRTAASIVRSARSR